MSSKTDQAFIAQASHDIKSLLTSVKAYVQLLERQLSKTEDEKSMQYVQKIDAQINKVTRMMSNLVDVYRIKSGMLELYREPSNVNELVLEMVEQMQAITTDHTISLSGKVTDSIEIDKRRFSQALENILRNAIMYSPEHSHIPVFIKQDKEKVVILIEDSGIGITKEKIPEILNPFSQEKEEGKVGLGTNVFISSAIIQAHGGELSIESPAFIEKISEDQKIGKGTRVKIQLPIN